MKTIVLATGNQNKAKEISQILGDDFEVLTMTELGIDDDIIEDGDTFEENALIKVRAVNAQIKKRDAIIMGDDSGLSVDALDGAPGIFSARYAGEEVTYTDNNLKLLREMAAVDDDKRGASFVTVIALLFPDGREETCEGIVRGHIARDFAGSGGFGYDPLFIHEETGRCYAEMTEAEKNAVSHRGVALKRAKSLLENQE
ncbi:MAG: XTP/dITP diphosphohydrolase [Eubacteriaceae bacterium]|jgi:XTP/dITP diphosphohydrolase|nr:XTP/dITP diphosphohydrolase [Eubacteriaceae bacterium]MDN5308374.1 XTP/dITP diphosphohydrolase [Eubacteriaceae bacterium]